MRNLNKMLLGTIVVAAAVAMVGTGAGATFIDTPSSNQTIQTGTMYIDLTGTGPGDSVTPSDGSPTNPAVLSLGSYGPTQSTFEETSTVTGTNAGTVTGTVTSIEMTGNTLPGNDVSANILLTEDGTTYNLCDARFAACSDVNLLGRIYAGSNSPASFTLAPNTSYTLTINYSAGENNPPSATTWTNWNPSPPLTNADEGKTINASITTTVTA